MVPAVGRCVRQQSERLAGNLFTRLGFCAASPDSENNLFAAGFPGGPSDHLPAAIGEPWLELRRKGRVVAKRQVSDAGNAKSTKCLRRREWLETAREGRNCQVGLHR